MKQTISEKRNKIFEYTLVTLFIGGLYAFYTFPLIYKLNSLVPGSSDAGVFYWNLFNYKASLVAGSPFVFTDWQLYPFGVDLKLHANTPLLCFLSTGFDNNVIPFNLYLIFHYLLAGVGTYALITKTSNNKWAGVFGAIAFTFSNYMLIRLGEHINLVSVGFVPFYFLYFFKSIYFDEKKWFPAIKKSGVLPLILLLFANVLSDYVVGILVILVSATFFAAHWLTLFLKQFSVIKRIIIVVATILVTDQLIQLMKNSWKMDDGSGFHWGADLLWYLLPYGSKIYDSSFINQLVERYMWKNAGENSVFFGYITILLFVWALYLYFRQKNRHYFEHLVLISIGLVFMISMPSFRIAGVRLFYSPTALMHFIPLINNFRCPARTSIVLSFLITLFAALQFSKVFNKKITSTIWIVCAIILIIELIPRKINFLDRNEVPGYYSHLSYQPVGGILIIPFGIGDGKKSYGHFFDVKQLFYQEVHQKKIVGGYVSRIPDETFQLFLEDGFLKKITALQEDEKGIAPSPDEATVFMLNFHPTYLIVKPAYVSDTMLSFIEKSMAKYIIKQEIVSGAYIYHLKNG